MPLKIRFQLFKDWDDGYYYIVSGKKILRLKWGGRREPV